MQFIIAGGGPLRDNLEALSTELNVTDFVQFKGDIPHSEIRSLLSTLDVSLNFRIRGETFGISNIESVVSCTPVVSVLSGANAESLHPNASLIFEEFDFESISNTLLLMLENPSGIEQLNARGLEVASKESFDLFRPSVQNGKILDAIENLMGKQLIRVNR